MAYNIHWALGPDGEVNTQRISDFIIAENVDLVGFNEVARFGPRERPGATSSARSPSRPA